MATIYDVAGHAGVSVGTVSRYLNGSGYVGEQTAERIAAAIAEVGYVPNNAARSLTTKRTGLIGFVVSDLTNPFSAEVAQGITDRAAEDGHCVLIGATDGDEERALRTLRVLREQSVDGVIVTPPESPAINAQLQRLHESGTSIAVIGMRLDPPVADRVTTATYEGAYAAVSHLTALGHRRIGMIAGSGATATKGRCRGYADALGAAEIALDKTLVCETRLDRAGGAAAANTLLDRAEPPTAIFCGNDAAALGVLQRVHERRLQVPRDLSVVGFDDIDLASHSVPPLTTVAQPKHEMGRLAATLLVDRMSRRGKGSEWVERRLDCELVVRESTAPPRKKGRT